MKSELKGHQGALEGMLPGDTRLVQVMATGAVYMVHLTANRDYNISVVHSSGPSSPLGAAWTLKDYRTIFPHDNDLRAFEGAVELRA